MVGKSGYHKENEKKNDHWILRKKNSSICVEQGISSVKLPVFTVPLEPSVPLHQHEEACVKDCVCASYFNIDA